VIPGKRYASWQLPDPKNEPLARVRAIRDDGNQSQPAATVWATTVAAEI
jgi:hypothetical protein